MFTSIRVCIVIACLCFLAGCASAEPSIFKNAAPHFIMRDMVGKVGAFAVVPERGAQPIFRRTPPEPTKAMLAMSWLGATEPAGTFLAWRYTLPGTSFTRTLIMQLQGDVKNSGGCEVVDWLILDDVNNWNGMLATMDGSRGGGDYLYALGDFTAHQRGDGSGDIILCPTHDPARVEVYAKDHYLPLVATPDNLLFAGTFTVNLPEMKNWIYTNGKAGDFIIKGAKAPPVESWGGPLPVPAARQQELAAGCLLAGCDSVKSRDSIFQNVVPHFIMRDMVGKIGAFAVVPAANAQPVIRSTPPGVAKAMLAMSWLGAHEPAGTFLLWSDLAFKESPALMMQLQGEIKNSGGCEVVDWTSQYDVTDWKDWLASMNGSRGGGRYMISMQKFTAHQQGSSSSDVILCPTNDPAKVEVYAADHDFPPDVTPDIFLFAGTFTVNLPEVKHWIYTNGKVYHLMIKGAKAPPVSDWGGPLPVPVARQQELVAGK